MIRYTGTLYLLVWNTLCLGLVALGFGFGIVQDVFAQDASRLTAVSAALLVFAIVYTTRQTVLLDRMTVPDELTIETIMAFPNFLKSKVFLLLGLCGTIVGLSLFASHMSIDADHATAEGIAATIATMQQSLQTAFHATLVGIVCKLWVEVITFIQGWSVRRLAWAVTL